MTFTIQGSHIEGAQFTALARVVGSDGTLLTTGTVEGLTVEVFLRTYAGPLLYKQEITTGTGTGISDIGQTGSGWTKSGVWNFRYVWDPEILLTGTPPFAFKAPRAYAIRYTFDSPIYGIIKVLHTQVVENG